MVARTPGSSDAAPAGFPQVFGRYTLLGRIGSGGMADALLAMLDGPMGFRKPMVIKRMHASLGRDSHFVKMFLDEARLAARLSHAHVVATSEVGECDGHYFIAMEYLEGLSLDRVARRYIQAGGEVPLGMLLRVLCDCLDGLHYAHELKDYDGGALRVVHRDVTPSNLFITAGGASKVLDFGIAKASTQDEATRTGMLKGKLAYMAPEQFMAAPIDRRSDLWSMGVVIWEMSTGRRLFKAGNDAMTYKNIVGADIPPLAGWRRDAPPGLDAVIARALARDRDARYPTAEAMRVDLEAVLRSQLGATSHGDVAAAMRDRFADILEENRRIIREFSRDHGRPGSVPVAVDDVTSSFTPTSADVRAVVPQFAEEPDDDPFAPRAPPPPTRQATMAAPAARRPAAPVFAPPVAPPVAPSRDEGAVETVVDMKVPAEYVAAAQAVIHRQPTAPSLAWAAPPPAVATPPPFAEPPPRPRQSPLVAAIGWLTFLGLLGAGGYGVWSQRAFIERAVREFTEGKAPDPTRVGTFQLRLLSEPMGAHVFEGTHDLGPTPIEMSVLRGQVADAPRRFEFRLAGHTTVAAELGTTREPRAELRVTLVPVNPRTRR